MRCQTHSTTPWTPQVCAHPLVVVQLLAKTRGHGCCFICAYKRAACASCAGPHQLGAGHIRNTPLKSVTRLRHPLLAEPPGWPVLRATRTMLSNTCIPAIRLVHRPVLIVPQARCLCAQSAHVLPYSGREMSPDPFVLPAESPATMHAYLHPERICAQAELHMLCNINTQRGRLSC
jgi:hypothetical protein